MRTLFLLLLLPLMLEAQWTLIPGTTNFELCGVHPTIPELIFERNLMTTNNGEDWLNVYPAPLSSIHCHPGSPDTLFFVGDTFRSETDHPVYHSFDGGQSWTFLGTSESWLFPEYSFITDMEIVNDVIHASMNNGGYTYSENWGTSWQSHNNTSSPNNFEIEVDASTTPPTIYIGSRAFGDLGKVERSTDGGQTWEVILGNQESIDVLDLKIDPVNPAIVYAVCMEIWTEKTIVYLLNQSNKEIIFESEAQSGDRGHIWINQENPNWLYLAIGCQESIYVSRDNGQTWSSLLWNLEFEPNFQFVDNANLRLSQPNHLVVSAQINGTRYLYQLTDTGQEDVLTLITQANSLLLTSYPNPFNPETKINFYLPRAEKVDLTIYNLQGQKVITLKTGYCTAGAHTVDFDGTNLPSGTYFYTLQTKNSTTTRKMLLVK